MTVKIEQIIAKSEEYLILLVARRVSQEFATPLIKLILEGLTDTISAAALEKAVNDNLDYIEMQKRAIELNIRSAKTLNELRDRSKGQ